jgi:hypothetical protein
MIITVLAFFFFFLAVGGKTNLPWRGSSLTLIKILGYCPHQFDIFGRILSKRLVIVDQSLVE